MSNYYCLQISLLFVSAFAVDVSEKKYDKRASVHGGSSIYNHGNYNPYNDVGFHGSAYGRGYEHGQGYGHGHGYGYGHGYGGIGSEIDFIGGPHGHKPSFGIGVEHGFLHHVPRTVNRVVPIAVIVPQLVPITRSIPVSVPHPVPLEVKRPVPVPIPQPVPFVVTKAYPINVPRPVPVPVPHAVPVAHPVPHPIPVPHPVPAIHTPASISQSIPINSDPYSLPARPISVTQPIASTGLQSGSSIRPIAPIGIGSVGAAGIGTILENGDNSGFAISGVVHGGNNFGSPIGSGFHVSMDSGSEGYSYPVPAKKFF